MIKKKNEIKMINEKEKKKKNQETWSIFTKAVAMEGTENEVKSKSDFG